MNLMGTNCQRIGHDDGDLSQILRQSDCYVINVLLQFGFLLQVHFTFEYSCFLSNYNSFFNIFETVQYEDEP